MRIGRYPLWGAGAAWLWGAGAVRCERPCWMRSEAPKLDALSDGGCATAEPAPAIGHAIRGRPAGAPLCRSI